MIFKNFYKYFFVFLACAYPLGQFLTIPLGFINLPEIKIYLIDLLIFIILALRLSECIFLKKKYILPPLIKHLFLFVGILFLSWITSLWKFKSEESFVGFLYLFRFLIYLNFWLVVYDLTRRDSLVWRKFWEKILWWWGIVMAVLGLFQYLLFPDIRFLSFLGWDLHYYRVTGMFLDPNYLGILFALAILFFINKSIIFPTILVIFPFFLTYSRSSYLALFFGIFFFLLIKKRLWLVIVVLITFIMAIVLLPRPGGEGVKIERTVSFFQRVENWEKAIRIWKRCPILGVGFNNYRYAQHNFGFLTEEDWRTNHAAAGVDNSFLFVLATSGILGEIFFWNFWIRVLIFSFRRSRLLFSSLIAIFIHSFFQNTLFYPWVMLWVWILMGLYFIERKEQ